jgi:rhamnose utilization protein RhaD (predicted bifunctional aldolase and dehydrogenase)
MQSSPPDTDITAALDALAAASRALGADPDFVLLGGGNTSLKQPGADDRGATLWVKGSGADLAQVQVDGFTPLALAPTRALLDGPALDGDALMQALAPHVLRATAPRPSIETLLHAALPHACVVHTHADAVLAVICGPEAESRAARVFGTRAPLVPFRYSGFDLARACIDRYTSQAQDDTIGLLLAFHGVVAFGDSLDAGFARMRALAARAEQALRAADAWTLPRVPALRRTWAGVARLRALRATLARLAGFPVRVSVDDSPEAVAFARRDDVAALASHGPPTPQHAVFTKRLPALGLDAPRYAAAYRSDLAAHGYVHPVEALPDPAPRVLLDPDFGAIASSVDAAHTRMSAEVWRHDLAILSRADAFGGYAAPGVEDILAAEVHYGGFERRALAHRERDRPLTGCQVLVLARSADTVAYGAPAPAPTCPDTEPSRPSARASHMDAVAQAASSTHAEACVSFGRTLSQLGADVHRLAIDARESDAIDAGYATGGFDLVIRVADRGPGPASVLPWLDRLRALDALDDIEPTPRHDLASLAADVVAGWRRLTTALSRSRDRVPT